jgi:hypothetical protein
VLVADPNDAQGGGLFAAADRDIFRGDAHDRFAALEQVEIALD